MTTKMTEQVMPAPLGPLLTMSDVERLLRVDKRTVYRLCRRGLIPPPFKLGGQNRWMPEDVAGALERMRGPAAVK
jgi:predicted DNA-binding transcriptional regulator AlpA